MKIICIGRNYSDHIKEMNNDRPAVPTFFMKPETAVMRDEEDFFLPDFSQDLQYETELVVKIDRLTKSIGKEFAHRCYSEVAVGLDLTARDLQRKCIETGLPWEMSKSFDKSAPIPDKFLKLQELGKSIDDLHFELRVNGEVRQQGFSGDMLFGIDEIIAYVSNFVTLKTGDLIFTGTPSGVGPLQIGDRVEASLEGIKMLDFTIK